MTIEYALGQFDRKLVELSCSGLDFEFEGRKQEYKGPLRALV